ncbi:hypothetical protein CXG81DRAFT_24813 [Caulochytrium protostelioides]|uniref:RanBD1 domain-containing protein n=1 Tax=Caulochytrium protostelioides TaxID=1555241 RepID=A0A4P9XAZ3_9FUNG|nr:hypothetical protein CXG81DRAFT_24813 [Caulochytrium protostelioides]|eukprot:RKP02526.1 hypothetical protein CXG81DRAFT_24813 [Caulochytrium protostelioides]
MADTTVAADTTVKRKYDDDAQDGADSDAGSAAAAAAAAVTAPRADPPADAASDDAGTPSTKKLALDPASSGAATPVSTSADAASVTAAASILALPKSGVFGAVPASGATASPFAPGRGWGSATSSPAPAIDRSPAGATAGQMAAPAPSAASASNPFGMVKSSDAKPNGLFRASALFQKSEQAPASAASSAASDGSTAPGTPAGAAAASSVFQPGRAWHLGTPFSTASGNAPAATTNAAPAGTTTSLSSSAPLSALATQPANSTDGTPPTTTAAAAPAAAAKPVEGSSAAVADAMAHGTLSGNSYFKQDVRSLGKGWMAGETGKSTFGTAGSTPGGFAAAAAASSGEVAWARQRTTSSASKGGDGDDGSGADGDDPADDGADDDDAASSSQRPKDVDDEEDAKRLRAATIETKTGEEDEVTLASTRCRLFQLGENGAWLERGVGALKVNATRPANPDAAPTCARLLMRAEGVLKLLLNARLHPNFHAEVAQEKYLRFVVLHGPDKPLETFLARTGSPASVKSLLDAMTPFISADAAAV